MSKYIYSVCNVDSWPILQSITATGMSEAELKVIDKYCNLVEIKNDDLDYLEFQEKLNDLGIVISDLYDIEEL